MPPVQSERLENQWLRSNSELLCFSLLFFLYCQENNTGSEKNNRENNKDITAMKFMPRSILGREVALHSDNQQLYSTCFASQRGIQETQSLHRKLTPTNPSNEAHQLKKLILTF